MNPQDRSNQPDAAERSDMNKLFASKPKAIIITSKQKDPDQTSRYPETNPPFRFKHPETTERRNLNKRFADEPQPVEVSTNEIDLDPQLASEAPVEIPPEKEDPKYVNIRQGLLSLPVYPDIPEKHKTPPAKSKGRAESPINISHPTVYDPRFGFVSYLPKKSSSVVESRSIVDTKLTNTGYVYVAVSGEGTKRVVSKSKEFREKKEPVVKHVFAQLNREQSEAIKSIQFNKSPGTKEDILSPEWRKKLRSFSTPRSKKRVRTTRQVSVNTFGVSKSVNKTGDPYDVRSNEESKVVENILGAEQETRGAQIKPQNVSQIRVNREMPKPKNQYISISSGKKSIREAVVPTTMATNKQHTSEYSGLAPFSKHQISHHVLNTWLGSQKPKSKSPSPDRARQNYSQRERPGRKIDSPERINPNYSSLGRNESNSSSPERIGPNSSSPERIGPKYRSPERIGPNYSSPERIGPNNSSLERNGSNSSSPEIIGPNNSSPERIGPNYSSPERIGPKYSSPERIGPNYSSPERIGPNNSSLERNGSNSSSPETIGPNNSSPERIGPNNSSPERIGPNNSSPERIGPNNIFPERISPNNISQERIGPNNISPEKIVTNPNSPESTWPNEKQPGTVWPSTETPKVPSPVPETVFSKTLSPGATRPYYSFPDTQSPSHASPETSNPSYKAVKTPEASPHLDTKESYDFETQKASSDADALVDDRIAAYEHFESPFPLFVRNRPFQP